MLKINLEQAELRVSKREGILLKISSLRNQRKIIKMNDKLGLIHMCELEIPKMR